MNEVLRQEKKFLINQKQLYRLSYYFSQVMREDPHNGADGYEIRSVYFDTLLDRDFQEKEDGTEIRRKIRLRNYGPKSDFGVLEMKQKQGAYQKKRSLKIRKEDAIELLRGNYSVLLAYDEPFAIEMFGFMNIHCYRPKAVVEYKRKAFIAKENKIRITFDHNIIATESNFDIFSTELLQYPVFPSDLVILEVKYNGFLLSYIKDLLKSVNESELSVSKYVLSRGVSKHYCY